MSYDPHRALELLRIGSGIADARFHDGQEEAIRAVVAGGRRLLVVQKTGWDKSFVYFIALKLLRESGSGPALLVSPLLALMRNQIAAATRMGVGSRLPAALPPLGARRPHPAQEPATARHHRHGE